MKRAFTLVELIVVITILAILGTIAFISLQSYSKEARDAKRIQDVRSLLTKLNVEQVKGTSYKDMLDTPVEHPVTINEITNIKAYQGPLNFELLRENRENFQDPESGGDYDFGTVKGTTEYNGKDQAYEFIQGRYWSEKDNIEVLLGNYYMYHTGDSETLYNDTLTGPNKAGPRPPLAAGVHESGSDLIVSDGEGNTITIQDRNLGATSNDISQCNSFTSKACTVAVAGYHYQWGRDLGFYYDKTITDINGDANERSPIPKGDATTNPDFIWSGTLANPQDWSSELDDDLRGNITDNPEGSDITARQGPCPPGYHIPTQSEWQKLTNIYMAYKQVPYTSGTYTWIDNALRDSFVTDLKLPLAGFRYWKTAVVTYDGSNSYYWSSTPNGATIYTMSFTALNVRPSHEAHRADGQSIRCFKN